MSQLIFLQIIIALSYCHLCLIIPWKVQKKGISANSSCNTAYNIAQRLITSHPTCQHFARRQFSHFISHTVSAGNLMVPQNSARFTVQSNSPWNLSLASGTEIKHLHQTLELGTWIRLHNFHHPCWSKVALSGRHTLSFVEVMQLLTYILCI
jgi:hypothetical protein